MRRCSRCLRRLRIGLLGGLRHGQRDLLVVRRAGAARRAASAKRERRVTSRAIASPSSVDSPSLLLLETPFSDLTNFDLLGRLGRDDRTAALLDPAAHPDAAAFELFRFDAGGGEGFARRRRMVTVKSRVQRRPKFTYIVAPLSRTDKTLPSTSAN